MYFCEHKQVDELTGAQQIRSSVSESSTSFQSFPRKAGTFVLSSEIGCIFLTLKILLLFSLGSVIYHISLPSVTSVFRLNSHICLTSTMADIDSVQFRAQCYHVDVFCAISSYNVTNKVAKKYELVAFFLNLFSFCARFEIKISITNVF